MNIIINVLAPIVVLSFNYVSGFFKYLIELNERAISEREDTRLLKVYNILLRIILIAYCILTVAALIHIVGVVLKHFINL